MRKQVHQPQIFCTGVVILNGDAHGEGKSLATLLIMDLVWGNLSHHLTYQQRARKSSSLAYYHFRIQGTLYFLIKWSRGVNLAPWASVLNLNVKFWKESFNGARNISTVEPNWDHQRMNQRGNSESKSLSKLTNHEWDIFSFWWSINLNQAVI